MIQNHMLHNHDDDDVFHEPSLGECRDAAFNVVESYILRDDAYELGVYLGEVVLEQLREDARHGGVLPSRLWADVVNEAARMMVDGWPVDAWHAYREQVGA